MLLSRDGIVTWRGSIKVASHRLRTNAPLVKITLVTETYPPEVNGVAMTLHRLVSGTVARGHQIEVIRPRQKGEDGKLPPGQNGIEQWLVAGVPIPFYQSLRIGIPEWQSLRKRWTAKRPDLVHVATEGPLGLAAMRAARGLRVPLTSSFHTNFHQYSSHYGINFGRDVALGYLRWFHNRTACTLVPTAQMKAELAAQRFQRLGILARGVDTQLFSPARRSEELRRSWGASPADPVVIYVGRIAAEKNLAVAVEAFLTIREKAPNARFVLVGDGPERGGLAAKYPNFHYAGVRRGEDLAAHYASADVFVFPSVTETFGNVVTEAMASGLVVLAYDYAATREHVRTGENGFAARFNDSADFLRWAHEILLRTSEWSRIREAARATTARLTWDAIVTQFEEQLLAAHKSGGVRYH